MSARISSTTAPQPCFALCTSLSQNSPLTRAPPTAKARTYVNGFVNQSRIFNEYRSPKGRRQ